MFLKKHTIIHSITAVIFSVLGVSVGVYLVVSSWSILSPLAEGSVYDPDPILENVKGAKTTAGYPPGRYFPNQLTPKFSDDLDLSAKGFAAMDRDTGELLIGREIDVERPIASLTKMMTTVIALEEYSLDAQLLVSRNAAKTGEAFMGVSEGEIVTVEDLLYGVMLPSGNDAAEVLAQGLRPNDGLQATDLATRRRNRFLQKMNEKAQSIGMSDTYFFNPTGLDERLQQLSTFSTPLDLLALANYALTNETFAQIAQTKEHIVPYKEGKHKAFALYNILQFDQTFEGIKGVKPGVTGYAGETLVSYLERDNRRIILVLLDSTATRDDAIKSYRFLLEER